MSPLTVRLPSISGNAPQRNYYPPSVQVVPSAQTPYVAPNTYAPLSLAKNAMQLPAPNNATPAPNNLAAPPMASSPQALLPAHNLSPMSNTFSLTQADIDAMSKQLQADNNKALDDLAGTVGLLAEIPIVNLPEFATLGDQKKADIVAAVMKGDPAAVAALLTPTQLASPAGKQLLDLASAATAINDARVKNNNGSLTAQDVTALWKGVNPNDPPPPLAKAVFGVLDFLPGDKQQEALGKIVALVGGPLSTLEANAKVTDMLKTATPGNNPVPTGSDVPIVLAPGLPLGAILPLGNGGAMVGISMDALGLSNASGDFYADDLGPLVLPGTGNVALAAGFPVGSDAPTPEVDGQPVTDGLLLINGADDSVNYSLNQQPFTMKPDYRHTLAAGASWIVEFDRGGDGGVASYTLTDGAYKFKRTEKGWELYKQIYNVTLANLNNTFPFNFQVNNQPQVIQPGESLDFTSSLPLAVRFDDSNGQVKQKRLESGHYQVAIAPDHSVDLFSASAVTQPSFVPVPTPARGTAVTSAPALEPGSQHQSVTQLLSKVPPRYKQLPPGFKLSNSLVGAKAPVGSDDSAKNASVINPSVINLRPSGR